MVVSVAAPANAATLTCTASASASVSPGMFFQGGSGLYTFATPSGLLNETTCSYNGGPRLPAAISSEGEFVNVLCGTATLDSPRTTTFGTTIDVGADGTREVASLRYRLTLRSWTGDVRVTHVNGRAEAGGDDVDGVLLGRPQHSCTFQPIVRFTLDGVFSLEW